MKLLLALLCAGGMFSQAHAAPVPDMVPGATLARQADCGDFLARMNKKPAHLAYAGCVYLPNEQGKPLRATYRVGGRNAGAVEAYLVRAMRLNRLRRSCCQWDSSPRQSTDARGREYTIRMVSDETAIASRKDWPRIARFEVTVETLTEEI